MYFVFLFNSIVLHVIPHERKVNTIGGKPIKKNLYTIYYKALTNSIFQLISIFLTLTLFLELIMNHISYVKESWIFSRTK